LGKLSTLSLGRWQLAFGSDQKARYYLLIAVFIGPTLPYELAMGSRWGWVLRAVRENKTAAIMMGVRVNRERAKALRKYPAIAGRTPNLSLLPSS
jgi:ABC-type branched-subunit amino acid transport system permease subunit